MTKRQKVNQIKKSQATVSDLHGVLNQWNAFR